MTNPFSMLWAATKNAADALNHLASAVHGLADDVEARKALTAPLDVPAIETEAEPSANGHGRKRVSSKA